MKWFWNNCSRERICLLVAGALDEQEKANVRRHLAQCQECGEYYRELQPMVAPLAGWEKNLSAVEVTRAAQLRWFAAVQQCASPSKSGPPVWRFAWQDFCREIIWPRRYAWGVMAALWAAMLVVNLQLSGTGIDTTSARVSSPREMRQAWVEQNTVLAELTQAALVVSVPPSDVLRPRSQRELNRELI